MARATRLRFPMEPSRRIVLTEGKARRSRFEAAENAPLPREPVLWDSHTSDVRDTSEHAHS